MRYFHRLCSTNRFELGSAQPACPLQRSVGGRIARNGAHILAYLQSTPLEQKLLECLPDDTKLGKAPDPSWHSLQWLPENSLPWLLVHHAFLDSAAHLG